MSSFEMERPRRTRPPWVRRHDKTRTKEAKWRSKLRRQVSGEGF